MGEVTSLLCFAHHLSVCLMCFDVELPRILMHPEPELMLEVGQKLYLACQATGPGTLSYQWYRNGDVLPYGNKMVHLLIVGM